MTRRAEESDETMSSTMQSRLLAPLLRQPTVLLTTWDRDGAAVQTPAHIAVAGDHAFIRTYDGSPNNARLRRTPRVEIAPVTARSEGAIRATARRLAGPDATIAARAMRRKYPIRQGWLIPRLYRLRGYRTVYYRLDPVAGVADPAHNRGGAAWRTRGSLPAFRHAWPTL